MQLKAILLSAVVAMVVLTPVIEANSGGKHFSSGGCGCHGGSSSTVSISENFPSSYTPGQTYSIQVSVSGGVTGTHGGFNVEVSKGSLSTGGNSGVKVSGKSVTHTNKANRAWSFDWTAPTSGSGTVTAGIAGLTASGGGTSGDAWTTTSVSITETVVVSNNPPTASNVQISPSSPTSSDDILLTYTFSDQDSGDVESGTMIHWSQNGAHQPQFDGLMTISSTSLLKGDSWQASVTPSDGEDFGATVNSNTVTVLNSLPSISSATISPPNPTVDDDLTASISGEADNDGDTLAFEYRWYLNGALQDGLDDLTIVPSLATRADDVWEVEVRAHDGEGHSPWIRSNTISVIGDTSNNAPTVESITVSPANPTTLDTLVASSTSFDADMDSIVDTQYRWSKNGILTTISTSALDSAMTTKGDLWAVEVRVNDGTEWSLWTTSTNLEILNTAPSLDSATISMNEAATDENVTVMATMSDVDGDQTTMSITWYLDGVIQLEYNNQATLPSSATNKGETWTAVVQANDGETTSSQSETLSVLIINSDPLLSVALENATSQDDLVLQTSIFDIDDDVTEVSTITWFRNGFREGSLDGALIVPSSYLGPGQEWSAEVNVTDGTSYVLSTASIIVENTPPSARISVLTDDLYAGERVTLSGLDSTDPDNSIVRYQWIWMNGASSGVEASFLMPMSGVVEVSLTVIDESGATNSTSIIIEPISALACPNLTQTVSDTNVQLDWTWASSTPASFEISRNGVVVGVTNETTFTDSPNVLGVSNYEIQTLLGDRILESPCQSPSVSVEIDAATIEFDEGPSTVAGLGLGSVYVIIGILLFVASLLRRGEEQ
ncbi:MAG: choice-of-anchor V domain-containing protein [Candidatus Thermoplasmatota archaeon]|nr:choice-of-anchor V domain-containing protein [Candidatus Thermoplasmatota archaeon]